MIVLRHSPQKLQREYKIGVLNAAKFATSDFSTKHAEIAFVYNIVIFSEMCAFPQFLTEQAISALRLDIDQLIWLFLRIIAINECRIGSQGYGGDIWRTTWAGMVLLGYIACRKWHFISVQGTETTTNSIFN